MTTFKVGDVVRAASEVDLKYLNAWSNFRITFETRLFVKKVSNDCLYFDGVAVGGHFHRFVPDIPLDRPLEDYL